MPPTPTTPGFYRYKTKDGQEVQIGDPTINREQLDGASFLGRQNDPTATDPLLKFPRYEQNAGTSAPAPKGSELFQAGGIFGNRNAPNETEIRERERQRVQATIDAIGATYGDIFRRTAETGEMNKGRVRATSAATGLLGSARGGAMQTQVEDRVNQELNLVEKERQAKISEVLTQADSRASEIIKSQRDEARANTSEYVNYLKGVATESTSSLKNLAAAGVTYDELMEREPTRLAQLLDQTGLTDMEAKALFIANAPTKGVGSIINKDKPQIIGNKAVFFVQELDKATGQMKLRTVELDLPESPGGDKKIKSTVSRKDGIYVLYEDGSYNKIGEPEPGSDTPEGAENVQAQFTSAQNALKKAKELAYAAGRGRSWVEGIKQGWIGATDYTNLEAYANTLRTSVLALATDPAVKKFFGPQMSNKDVELLTAAGTSLNPELMGPDAFVTELTNIESLFNRLAAAKGASFDSGGATQEDDAGTGYQPGEIVEYNGVQYRVGADGDSLEEL